VAYERVKPTYNLGEKVNLNFGYIYVLLTAIINIRRANESR